MHFLYRCTDDKQVGQPYMIPYPCRSSGGRNEGAQAGIAAAVACLTWSRHAPDHPECRHEAVAVNGACGRKGRRALVFIWSWHLNLELMSCVSARGAVCDRC